MKEESILKKIYKDNICIGSLCGLLIDTKSEKLLNYLRENINDTGCIYSGINSLVKDTLIIKSLNVLEQYQGNGYGKNMLKDLIEEYNPESMLLVADVGRKQRVGFNLITFYKKSNFKEIGECVFYPLMFWPSNKADEMMKY